MKSPPPFEPTAHDCSGKRLTDVALAAVALVLSTPVQLVVALLVRRKLGRPILFRQLRPGMHGRPFELLKFRTMLTPQQAGGAKSDAARLTPFGAWLRGTSLDELPSLWNVLRGDMSLVGPRPLLLHYMPHYSAHQARRHEVRPGLTGLAQVAGRNAVKWEDRLALDVVYVDTRSAALDARILLQTLLVVLRKEGITAHGEATMSPFAAHDAPRAITMRKQATVTTGHSPPGSDKSSPQPGDSPAVTEGTREHT